MLVRYKLVFLAFLVCLGCSGVESTPVELPIPFSGNLTAQTSLNIAEGEPISGGSTFPIVWELFDSNSGGRSGTVNFKSISNIQTQPFPSSEDEIQNGSERRNYVLDFCASTGCGNQFVCASQAECFEYPSPYSPSASLSSFAASIGGVPEVKKMVCSGNIDQCLVGDCPTGELMDFKSKVGMVRLPDGSLQFHSQEDSAVIIHGTPFCTQPGDPDAEVLFTVIVQGFVEQVPAGTLPPGVPPLPPDTGPIVATFNFPIVEQGTGEIVGVGLNHLQEFLMVSEEEISFTGIADFIFGENFASTGIFNADLGDNFARIPNVTFRAAIAPELNEPMDVGIRTSFLDDPNFTEAIFTENGGNATFPTVSQTEPVRCSQPGQSAGIFEERCQEFGPLRTEFRCLTKINDDPFGFFTAQGVWIFSKP